MERVEPKIGKSPFIGTDALIATTSSWTFCPAFAFGAMLAATVSVTDWPGARVSWVSISTCPPVTNTDEGLEMLEPIIITLSTFESLPFPVCSTVML